VPEKHNADGYVMFARGTYKDSKTWQNLNPVQKVIMITLIMLANHKDGNWWDNVKKVWVPVKRGQLITSLDRLQKACGKGVSVQNIRTCFVNLEKMGFLTYKSTKQYRLVTIANYDFYQCSENYQQSNQQKPNKGLTINNNDKNEKNKDLTTSTTEQKILNSLKQVDGYPFENEKDLEYIRTLSIKFPGINIAAETEKWAVYKLDKPLKRNSNPRLQLHRWIENAGKFNRKPQPKMADKMQQLEALFSD